MLHALIAAIPAPPGASIHIGPLQVRGYALMIILGVAAAVWFAQRRWQQRGGDPADITAIAMWAVPAGIIGGRAYHVITDPELFRGRWLHVFAIWEGGLGIPGGILAGVVAGAIVARQRRLPILQLMDVVAPALPLAQAIGRVGNWFNQELFGRPTSLPWGLHVDLAHARRASKQSRPIIRRSCMSRCGTSPSWACFCSSNAASGFARADSSWSTSAATHSDDSGSKHYASTTPTASWDSASTPGPASSRSPVSSESLCATRSDRAPRPRLISKISLPDPPPCERRSAFVTAHAVPDTPAAVGWQWLTGICGPRPIVL
jgi:Prolipoprotein diacylglyceryl transferase